MIVPVAKPYDSLRKAVYAPYYNLTIGTLVDCGIIFMETHVLI